MALTRLTDGLGLRFGIDFILVIFDIAILKNVEVSILILFRGIDFNVSFDISILIDFLL